MWSNQHSLITDATREQIWRVWSDVENWNKWDQAVEWCKMAGSFKAGSSYSLKPVNGPKAQAVIVTCEPLKSFRDISRLPLARLEFNHTLSDAENGQLRITHQVIISGPLSFLFARVIGKQTVEGLPQAMQNLVRLAKQS